MSENKTFSPKSHAEASQAPGPEQTTRREPLEFTKPPREWRRAPRQESSHREHGAAPLQEGTEPDLLDSLHLPASRSPAESASSHLEVPRPGAPEARKEATALPCAYGVDRLVLLVRDPDWSYAWWELTEARLEAARHELGEKGSLILRFYDVSLIDWDGRNHHECFDIEVQALAGNWYVELGKPGATFVAEIGLRGMKGRFVALVRSNVVALPRNSMSPRVDEQWMISEERYQRLFELSGGAEIGLGSAEILRALEERLRRELAEAGVSSFGISSLASRRES